MELPTTVPALEALGRRYPWALGALVLVGAWWWNQTRALRAAVDAPAGSTEQDPLDFMTDQNAQDRLFKAKLTTYYPKGTSSGGYASSAEATMEGGALGAALWRGRRVVDPSTGARVVIPTVEDARAGRSSYAGVSSDPAVFPWGQALRIDTMPDVLFRVVDTGGRFRGDPIYDVADIVRGQVAKLYRIVGYEPLDIAGDPGSSHAGKANVTIVAGDKWGEGDVDESHIYDQQLTDASTGYDG